MNKDELMRKIQNLSFAKTEAELFLDTHPECRAALDFYKDIVRQLDEAMTDYQNRFGPIVAESAMSDRWTWVDGPWPWHMEHHMHNGHMNGERTNNTAREGR